jgi:hypothetical protein
MNPLARLQEWYLSQCNEDWEHTYGVAIGTLDNPGWSFDVDLTETDLDGRTFAPVEYGIGADSVEGDQNWISCQVVSNKFTARGGPRKLDEMILTFVEWANECRPNKSLERTRDR